MRTFTAQNFTKKQFPTAEDFRFLNDHVADTIERMGTSVVCAVQTGSTVQGTPGPSSDIDLVIVLEDEAMRHGSSARTRLCEMHQEVAKRHIPVSDIVCIRSSEAAGRDHVLTPGYTRYLRRCGRMLRGSPGQIPWHHMTNREDFGSYTAKKLKRLRNVQLVGRIHLSSDHGQDVLQDILTAWKYAAIRFAEIQNEASADSIEAVLAHLPSECRPAWDQLSTSQSMHKEAIARQVILPNPSAWKVEQNRLFKEIDTLVDFLEELERHA